MAFPGKGNEVADRRAGWATAGPCHHGSVDSVVAPCVDGNGGETAGADDRRRGRRGWCGGGPVSGVARCVGGTSWESEVHESFGSADSSGERNELGASFMAAPLGASGILPASITAAGSNPLAPLTTLAVSVSLPITVVNSEIGSTALLGQNATTGSNTTTQTSRLANVSAAVNACSASAEEGTTAGRTRDAAGVIASVIERAVIALVGRPRSGSPESDWGRVGAQGSPS